MNPNAVPSPSPAKQSTTPDAEPAKREVPAYEPPRLVLVGDLRNLLGKSGHRGDTGVKTYPTRP